MIDGLGISSKIAPKWILLYLADTKSALVQVVAWCRQTACHYLIQCSPIPDIPPYGLDWLDHNSLPFPKVCIMVPLEVLWVLSYRFFSYHFVSHYEYHCFHISIISPNFIESYYVFYTLDMSQFASDGITNANAVIFTKLSLLAVLEVVYFKCSQW